MNGTQEPGREPCDVFIIDDDPDTLDLVLVFFSKRGISAKGLATSKDYVRVIREARPRVLLLDVMMPGFNGYSLCREIKNDPSLSTVAVYFMTALPPEDVLWHVKSCGADGFIAKPFTLHELERVVSSIKSDMKK